MKPFIVYVVSDAAGDTGEAVIKAASAQFHPHRVEIRRFPFTNHIADIDHAVLQAKKYQAIIVFTLVLPELKDYLLDQSHKHQIVCIDLLGSVLQSFEERIGTVSKHRPGIIHKLDDEYFKKVDAVEFAVKYDDGRNPSGILEADIVLVGVSRTSKTPLSMYLAHKTYKVANVPIVPEISPPKELFTIPAKKIIGLKIDPYTLNRIRTERLRSLGLGSNATYAKKDRIMVELNYARKLMDKLKCTVIDVSSKAVEETASIILEKLSSDER